MKERKENEMQESRKELDRYKQQQQQQQQKTKQTHQHFAFSVKRKEENLRGERYYGHLRPWISIKKQINYILKQ